jgi:hypothetical protein
MHEQRRGRKGSWPMGRPVGWGLAGGGEGGYDRWARARENGKEEKKTKINSNLKLAIETYSNLIPSKQDLPKL